MRQEHDAQARVLRRHVGHMLVGPGGPETRCVLVAGVARIVTRW
jgi:hypothetical protein